MKIDVTDEDIAQGVRRSALRCPVQRAAVRTLQRQVSVHKGIIIIEPEGFWFRLPKQAQEAIAAYDQGELMVPFSFDMPATGYRFSTV